MKNDDWIIWLAVLLGNILTLAGILVLMGILTIFKVIRFLLGVIHV